MLDLGSTKRRYLVLFVLLFFISLSFYWKARGGVFTFDMLDWVKRYDELGIRGFLINFNDVSFRPFIHVLMFSGYSIFGVSPAVAITVSCLFHSFNALMLIWFCNKLSKQNQLSYVAILIGFIFLLSPYQTEVVVWGVGFLYSSLMAFLWIMVWSAFKYSISSQRKYLIIHFFSFLLAILIHELAFTFPFVIIVLVTLLFETKSRKFMFLFESIMALFLLLSYLVINRAVLGVWVGHYGVQTHLHLDIKALVTTFSDYILKFSVLLNWWENPLKDKVFNWISDYPIWVLLLIIFFTAFILFLIREKQHFKLVFALLIIYGALIFPVLNLYFLNWIPIHGDRLGYLPSAFFYAAICIAAVSLQKHIGYIYCTAMLLISSYFLNVNNANWKNAGNAMQSLEASFPELGNRKAIILACADNFNGAYMYRCRVDYPFAEALRIKANRDYTKQTTEVLSYNMASNEDSLNVSVIDSLTLKVEFAQWGNWWWHDKAGATSFKMESYDVTIDDWSHSFLIHFKRKPDNALYLYQSKDSWKTVPNF